MKRTVLLKRILLHIILIGFLRTASQYEFWLPCHGLAISLKMFTDYKYTYTDICSNHEK